MYQLLASYWPGGPGQDVPVISQLLVIPVITPVITKALI
jgi:hypothetical protein